MKVATHRSSTANNDQKAHGSSSQTSPETISEISRNGRMQKRQEMQDQTSTPPSSNRNVGAFRPSLSMDEEDDGEQQRKKKNVQKDKSLQSILRPNMVGDRDSSSIAFGNSRKRRRRVGFTVVQIRRYPMILADNPACPNGPPLGLGWEYEVLPKMSIMDFESFRLRSRRFQMSHLILSHYKRLEIVQHMGYSEAEIADMEKEMAIIHRQRRLTMTFSPFDKIEHALRSVGRKLQRLFLCRKRRCDRGGGSVNERSWGKTERHSCHQ